MSFWMMFLLFFSLADAKQTNHKVKKNSTEWSFFDGWTNANGKKYTMRYVLPAALLKGDLEERLRFPKKKAAQYVAQKTRQWGKKRPRFKIKARESKGQVVSSISGPIFGIGKVKKQMKKFQEKAYQQFLVENGYTYLKLPFQMKEKIAPDHIKHIEEYVVHLKPIVAALGGPTKEPRVFAEKALSFVQNIPYEKRALKNDLYRKPISILGRNRGDCDSKTVLFLALMRAAYPKMDMGVVYIKNHAFGVLELDPKSGETDFRKYKKRWVAVEPVGPALKPIGKIGCMSKWKLFWRLYTLRTLGNP